MKRRKDGTESTVKAFIDPESISVERTIETSAYRIVRCA